MNASFKDLDTEVMWEAGSWILLGNSNISSICMLCFCMVMCWVAAGANASGFTFPYFVSVLLVLCLLYLSLFHITLFHIHSITTTQQHTISILFYFIYISRWFSTLCSSGKFIVSQYELSLSAFL